MYELSSSLAGKRSQEAVVHTVAQQIRQLFQASLVNVLYRPDSSSPSIVVSEPKEALSLLQNPPDRAIPIENAWGLIGEIQIWRGAFTDLPAEDSRLLSNFASQTAQALERTRLSESRDAVNGAASKIPARQG
jgi:K+-sensing histidine kinase KdpD